jgi:hypothetical protein
MFAKTPVSERQYCKTCGGHIMVSHRPIAMIDVFTARIPTFDFKTGVHVNYQETVLPIKDGLPKLKDFPKEFGGSGKTRGEERPLSAAQADRLIGMVGSCRVMPKRSTPRRWRECFIRRSRMR